MNNVHKKLPRYIKIDDFDKNWGYDCNFKRYSKEKAQNKLKYKNTKHL